MKLYGKGLLLALFFAIIPFFEIGVAEGAGTQDMYAVQVMAVKDKASALAFADSLKAKGYDAYVVMAADDETGLSYKVRFGRFEDKQDAERSAADYEQRESAECYVTRNMREIDKAPLAPSAALPEKGQARPAAETVYQEFYESLTSSGPLFGSAYLEILPEFSYRLQYEDNVDWDSSDKISDWSNVYQPAIDVTAFLNPQLSVKTVAELRIGEYIDEKDFNYVDQDYAFTLGYLANERTEFSLGTGYRVDSSTSRFFGEDASIDDYFTRKKDKTKDFNAGVSYYLSRKSTISLSGFISHYDSATTSGSDFFGGLADYTYNLGPRTDLLISFNYFKYDFDGNNKIYDIEDETDFYNRYAFYNFTLKNYSFTAGLGHWFKPDCQIRGLFGFRYSKNDSEENFPGQDKNSSSGSGEGWTGEFEFEWRFTPDYLVGVSAHQDMTINQYGGTYESTVFKLNQRYSLTRRLELISYLGYTKQDGDGDEFTSNKDSDLYSIQTVLAYKVKRWLTTRLMHRYSYIQYNYEDRSSIHGNMVFLEFTFTPTRPLVIR